MTSCLREKRRKRWQEGLLTPRNGGEGGSLLPTSGVAAPGSAPVVRTWWVGELFLEDLEKGHGGGMCEVHYGVYDDLSILLPVHRSQFSDGANDIRTRGQSVG